ncbi:MAG: hypothetical protein JKY52_06380 [Flavobacteriales bacterium]|nr:hypothetical protein [Flavobacteriales bacterium]
MGHDLLSVYIYIYTCDLGGSIAFLAVKLDDKVVLNSIEGRVTSNVLTDLENQKRAGLF